MTSNTMHFRKIFEVTIWFDASTGVGRGVNKLVSTLNPLKLSPNAIRKNLGDGNSRDVQQLQYKERGKEQLWIKFWVETYKCITFASEKMAPVSI